MTNRAYMHCQHNCVASLAEFRQNDQTLQKTEMLKKLAKGSLELGSRTQWLVRVDSLCATTVVNADLGTLKIK
jgi:hypothetical protein